MTNFTTNELYQGINAMKKKIHGAKIYKEENIQFAPVLMKLQ